MTKNSELSDLLEVGVLPSEVLERVVNVIGYDAERNCCPVYTEVVFSGPFADQVRSSFEKFFPQYRVNKGEGEFDEDARVNFYFVKPKKVLESLGYLH